VPQRRDAPPRRVIDTGERRETLHEGSRRLFAQLRDRLGRVIPQRTIRCRQQPTEELSGEGYDIIGRRELTILDVAWPRPEQQVRDRRVLVQVPDNLL